MPKKLIKLVKGKQNFPKCKTQPDCDLKIQLNGKRLFETDSVKCLRIQIDRRLTWKQQINHVALKLNKASAMLSKLRHVLDIKTLEFHLCYTSLIWVQNINSVKRLHLLQKIPLFKVSKLFKSSDKTALENYIFISKSLKRLLPSIFNSWFKFFLSHTLMIIGGQILVILLLVKIPFYCTKTYCRCSMFVNATYV